MVSPAPKAIIVREQLTVQLSVLSEGMLSRLEQQVQTPA